MAAKPIPVPQRAAVPEQRKTPESICDRGLELKIQMADLEAEYAEIKPAIEAYCEANGGVYNSPLGSYSTRITPKYEYPATIELQRIELKQAEERARLDGTAILVNNTVSVAANILKRTRIPARPIR
jgi:hypothetical protein